MRQAGYGYLQSRSSWAWSLSNLAALLRFNLLTYRDLRARRGDQMVVVDG